MSKRLKTKKEWIKSSLIFQDCFSKTTQETNNKDEILSPQLQIWIQRKQLTDLQRKKILPHKFYLKDILKLQTLESKTTFEFDFVPHKNHGYDDNNVQQGDLLKKDFPV